MNARLLRLDAILDELERKIVFSLISQKKRHDYWKITREIRRGSIGEPK
jgi:hypothetical protein